MSETNHYLADPVAAVYDLETSWLEDDIPFYYRWARQQGGKVLDLACGTGRVLIPLARAGIVVTGVDLSEPMLERCEQKMASETAEAQSNITLGQFDMRDFKLLHSFDMAFIAFSSYIMLTSVHDEEATIRNVHKHLYKNGVLIVDIFDPDPAILAQPDGHVIEKRFEDDGRTLVRRDTLVAHDPLKQTKSMHSQYELTPASGPSTTFDADWKIRYSYPFEAQHLIRLCGFKIEGVCGNYDGDPPERVGGRLIIVARKV